jgi:hypothetical protein
MSANASQIMFFTKNAADYQNSAVVLTASEASALAPNLQKRSNQTGWMTTGSVDSNNTTILCNFVNLAFLTNIILVNHNFAAFTIQYWNGSAYVDFSTPINVSGSTDTTTNFIFSQVQTTKILITILGTQVPNTDKRMTQLIATTLIGQLNGWPIIQAPSFQTNKAVNQMLSGKSWIGQNLGGFQCTLAVNIWSNGNDLSVVETLYGSGEGFLVWLCGGSQTQFSSVRQGYSLQDFFLMKPSDYYTPEWAMGLYKSGMKIAMALVEVTT